ncbi:MAG: iron ABC transporter permease [Bacteroidales bacterium]|nr:iron ABC transporter permease [Bacteroidales bacterium]
MGSESGWNIESILKRRLIIFTFLILILTTLFLADILFGSVKIGVDDIIRSFIHRTGTVSESIIYDFRIPKALTALLAGIALSVSGLQMQTVFRNPLAGPYVLGISAGASLGVAVVMLGFASYFSAGSIKLLGNWLIVISAWLGAGLLMILIMIISSRVRDIMVVLIIGIMLSGGISAIVTIMQYFSHESVLKAYIVWTMGSLGNLTGQQLLIFSFSVAVGLLLSGLSVKMLNALVAGETYARSIGLNLKLSRILIFTAATVLSGSVTAFCGPIAFIGIAVPHITRLLFKTSDHKILVPGTILTGGTVMIASDIISQLPGSNLVLPVNSVTSVIGIPVVIWVIFRNRRFHENK